MFNMSYEEIISKISEESKLSKEEIEKKVKDKISKLSGLVSKEGAAHIVANELGIQLIENFNNGKLEINNIVEGMRNVEIIGKVIRKYDTREFKRKDNTSGKRSAITLADETGSIRVVFWDKQTELAEKLKIGDTVKIKNAYARKNNFSNKIELQINENSNIEINPKNETVDVKVSNFSPKRKSISDITEEDDLVEILGTIVNVFDIRFFESCPHCNKKVKERDGKFYCDIHGEIEPSYRAILNLILDDGTDTIQIVLFNEQVKVLLGLSDEDLLSFREDPLKFEETKTEIFGMIVKIQGRVSKNELFSKIELIANRVIPNPDPEEEIKDL